MANWDFCDECNGGRHCCAHDECNHDHAPSISSYTVKELKAALKAKTKDDSKEKIKALKEGIKDTQRKINFYLKDLAGMEKELSKRLKK